MNNVLRNYSYVACRSGIMRDAIVVSVDSPVRVLRCAWCEAERPDNDEPCPRCGRPRFRHKTASPSEFWEHQRELNDHGR
jgi:hypothetical protein